MAVKTIFTSQPPFDPSEHYGSTTFDEKIARAQSLGAPYYLGVILLGTSQFQYVDGVELYRYARQKGDPQHRLPKEIQNGYIYEFPAGQHKVNDFCSWEQLKAKKANFYQRKIALVDPNNSDLDTTQYEFVLDHLLGRETKRSPADALYFARKWSQTNQRCHLLHALFLRDGVSSEKDNNLSKGLSKDEIERVWKPLQTRIVWSCLCGKGREDLDLREAFDFAVNFQETNPDCRQLYTIFSQEGIGCRRDGEQSQVRDPKLIRLRLHVLKAIENRPKMAD